MLVFFGFTICPDNCPTPLSDISGGLEALGGEAENLNVVFITVEPDRDTVEAMANYVRFCHPALRGWTGPDQHVARAVGGFRASNAKIPTDNGDFTTNRTSSVFLFDASGRFLTTIDYHEEREFAVPRIRRAMRDDFEAAT